MARVLTLGLSPFLITASDSGLIIIMNMVIRHYGAGETGDVLLTCNTIVQSFMLMVTMPLGGITGGTQTILGYNYGAGRADRIRRAQKHIVALGIVFTAIMFVIAMTVSGYFAEIFTRDSAYVDMSVRAIRISTLGIIPLAIQYEVVDGFTGMGAAGLGSGKCILCRAGIRRDCKRRGNSGIYGFQRKGFKGRQAYLKGDLYQWMNNRDRKVKINE